MNKFDQWIFNSFQVTPESLGIYRILFALFTILVISPGHSVYTQFDLLSNFPDSFFDPAPGPMMLFSGIPPEAFFNCLLLALNISLIALLVGYRTFWASLSTGVLLLVGLGFSYSLGKVNHTLPYSVLPIILMWSNWGAGYSWDAYYNLDKQPKVESWPLTLLILIVGFMFFTAGFPKILGDWLSFDTLATRGHLFNQYFVSGRMDLMAGWFITLEARWFWLMLDYLTIIFEVGFLIAILHPVSARIFLVIAVFFHAGTMLMLNIAFANNIIVYGAFVNWKNMLPAMKFNFNGWYQNWTFLNIPAIYYIIIAGSILYLWGAPLNFLNQSSGLTSDLMLSEVLTVAIALAGVIITYSIKLFITLLRSNTRERLTETE
ncbi:MAG: HTTM domain-containing protein [Balneolales bacterium]